MTCIKSLFIVCLMIVNCILIVTFQLGTEGLHQAIVLTYWVELFIPRTVVVSDWLSWTSFKVGWFWFEALLALLEEETVPCAVLFSDNCETEDTNETLY